MAKRRKRVDRNPSGTFFWQPTRNDAGELIRQLRGEEEVLGSIELAPREKLQGAASSADGRVWAAIVLGSGWFHLLVGTRGGKPRRIHRIESGDTDVGCLAVSPTGEFVAYTINVPNDPGEIECLALAGKKAGKPKRLDAECDFPAGLCWSDPRTLVYVDETDFEFPADEAKRTSQPHGKLERFFYDAQAGRTIEEPGKAPAGKRRKSAAVARSPAALQDWPTHLGPWDRTRAAEHRIASPVEPAWELKLTQRFGDGWIVGGHGVGYVTTRGTDILKIDLATGEILWEAVKVREKEESCQATPWGLATVQEVPPNVIGFYLTLLAPETGRAKRGLVFRGFFNGIWGQNLINNSSLIKMPAMKRGEKWSFRCRFVQNEILFAEDGVDEDCPILAYDPAREKQLWRRTDGLGLVAPAVGSAVPGVIARRKIPQVYDRVLLSLLDAATGKTRWEKEFPIEISQHAFSVTDGRLVAKGARGVLAIDLATGRMLWEARLPIASWQTPILTGDVLWTMESADEKPALVARDAATGKVLASRGVKAKNAIVQGVLDDLLIVLEGGRLVAYRSKGEG